VKRLPLYAALATFALHLVANPHYGFFRDELYFIVCGRHPDWGYVDQPPLVPLLSAGTQMFGTSLFAIRALPAIFAAGSVYMACLLALEIGAGSYGVLVTALLTAFVPILNAFGTKVSTDTPGLFFWPFAAFCVARIINGGSPRWWLAAGVALGICAEAKYTVFFFAAAMILGIALSPVRRILVTPWFLAGVVAGSAISLPSLLWQIAHGWPFVTMLEGQQAGTAVIYGPLAYVVQQMLIVNPAFAPVLVAGLVYAFARPRLRWIGWTYVLLIVAMIGLHGHNYYPGDVYPLLAATGALAIERTAALQRYRSVIVVAIVAIAFLTFPFVYPVVDEAQLAATIEGAQRFAHLEMRSARSDASPITQNFADMHGWPELAATVARVYRGLPPADRARAAIFANNFGEAGAIDVYGAAYGLPHAISGHNNYWLWGPRGYDGSVLIEVGGTCSPQFQRAAIAVARTASRWALPPEIGLPISVCYGLREPVATFWSGVRRFI